MQIIQLAQLMKVVANFQDKHLKRTVGDPDAAPGVGEVQERNGVRSWRGGGLIFLQGRWETLFFLPML